MSQDIVINRNEDDPLLQYKSIRMNDIKEISEFVRGVKSSEIRRTINYYPFRFFADGVQAYWYLFDNAVIYYSGMAVEIGLLIRLKDFINTLKRKRADRYFTPTFEWLINHSQSILDEELKEKAHNVRKIRNCYLHYENIVAHTAKVDQVDWPETVDMIKAEFSSSSERLAKIDALINALKEQAEEEGMLTVRFDFLEVKRETMAFIENRICEYTKWFPEILRNKQNLINYREFSALYSLEAFDARSCLEWSYEILNALGFFS